MKVASALLVAVLAAFNAVSGAHDSPSTREGAKALPAREHPFGRQGEAKNVSRKIAIDMNDTMRYSPATLQIKRGETVRLEVANSGKVMHELVLGTMTELKEHAEFMRKHAATNHREAMEHADAMHHEAAHMLHVQPGKKQTLVWQFTKPGEFYYACLIPGHLEAGMIGKIVVTAPSDPTR